MNDDDADEDVARGLREFVVGTGGTSLRSMGQIANSEARSSSTKGVIMFTLGPGTYQWGVHPGRRHDVQGFRQRYLPLMA